ncbi:hypothetical protein ACH5RR_014713 [Cinchona calisaya]|uniref:HECT-type E3 ubiquitin transferase n=1 Tax=Cinchona calisaya TaxID=153742 RepID=A0ABD2ZR24_9GENT
MSSRPETLRRNSSTAAAKRKLDDFHSDSDDDFFPLGDSSLRTYFARMRRDNFAPAFSTASSPRRGRTHDRSAQSSRSSSSSVTSAAVGDEESGSRSGSSSCVIPALQFFVRMLSSSKTLVIHADPSDSVKTVLGKIHSVTGIPIEEQRLIYRGKQLQCDQSLADCDVQKDASLQLVSRMRSTTHPKAWNYVDGIISNALHIYKCGLAAPAVETLKSMLVEFLTEIPQDNEESSKAYIQIFASSSATAALVMLYSSPVKSSRDCAYDCIKHFIDNCKTFSKRPVVSGELAHIVLEFCKLLSRGVGIGDPLYNICRSCLGSMMEYIGILFTETKMSKGFDVTEIFPFLCELATKLSQELASSVESNIFVGPTLGVVRDFVAFSRPIRLSLGLRDWIALALPNKCGGGDGGGTSCRGENNVQHYVDEIKSLHLIFYDLLGKMNLCLKKLEEHLAAVEKGKREHPVLGCCQYFTILKELNSLSKFYKGAKDAFRMRMRQRKVAFCYLILKFAKRNEDNKWIIEHKEVTTFEVRRHLAMMLLPEVKDQYEGLHEMLIDRSQLLAESFEYIVKAKPDSLRAGLFMGFKNEEATGPGVLREWFFLVCQEIFNPQNALFMACPNDRRKFFPNPASKVNPMHLDYFKFCGRLIALALMHKIQVGVVLDRAFFLQLAGKSVSLEDIQDADPYLYSSCKQILEMDPEAVDQDVLGLTFVREVEELGSRKIVELCPNGQSVVVNSKNRKHYVDRLIEHRFVTSVREQIIRFAEGFSAIVNDSNIQNPFFENLEPEDLDWILHGSESAISVEDWMAHTEFSGYKDTDPQIFWFWKIVGRMSAEQKKILLFFWTSIKHLPVEGFGGLASKLYIYRSHESNDRLPSSHTCFYQLCFPPYPSMSVMQDRLFLITREHVGCSFGTC